MSAVAGAPVASGSEQAMPILIINMGGEMLYILEQRLQAQAIVEEKSLRVLQDVISTMFSEKFISELFKAQKMYSSTSTRQIFDRLAHSSIMRLNTSSMDKLYDLMTMGCKYQVVSCAHPLDLYQVCLNHLDALRVLVRTSPEVGRLVENCVTNLEEMFARMRVGDLHLLRYTLARFFQDRRVKVSLFLTDALQAQDGSMIHSHAGRLPLGSETPGAIRYYDASTGKLTKEEHVKLPNSEHLLPPAVGVDIKQPGRPCELGQNLYAKDRRKKGNAAGAANAAAAANAKAGAAKSASAAPSASFEPDDASKKAATSELNLLAQMIGGGRANLAKETEKFSIANLFPDSSSGADGTGAGSEGDNAFITFDVDSHESRAAALSKKLGGMDINAGGSDADLLDLMDAGGQNQYDD